MPGISFSVRVTAGFRTDPVSDQGGTVSMSEGQPGIQPVPTAPAPGNHRSTRRAR